MGTLAVILCRISPKRRRNFPKRTGRALRGATRTGDQLRGGENLRRGEKKSRDRRGDEEDEGERGAGSETVAKSNDGRGSGFDDEANRREKCEREKRNRRQINDLRFSAENRERLRDAQFQRRFQFAVDRRRREKIERKKGEKREPSGADEKNDVRILKQNRP